MKKDVIYIDIEDDITAIIGKVKDASAKIIALVPPKRAGVLQSAVNLKLLQKSALEADKRIVLITNDALLLSLAAGVKLPVARNLQSRPEVPAVAMTEVDDEDIINGEDLPTTAGAKGAVPAAALDSAADTISKQVQLSDTTPAPSKAPAKSKFASKISIPNFGKFRLRLILGVVGALALGSFLFWALAIAPAATVIINASTSAVGIDRTLSLVPTLDASKVVELKLKPIVKQFKKSTVVEFEATGSKEIGEKASGTITIRNCDYASGFTLPADTRFTSSNSLAFVSTQAVTVPQFSGSASGCSLGGSNSGKASVPVKAVAIGPEYNIAAGAYAIIGMTGNVDAVGTDMSGGSKETVTVVSQEDADKAKGKLAQQDIDVLKKELGQQFSADQLVIDESFAAEAAAPAISPAVGEQAKQAKLSVETTYTLLGVVRSEIKQLLADALKTALEAKPNQSVFSDGENEVHFQSFQKLGDNTFTARLTTTGYIGTTIDARQLANQLKGKRYGEIEQIVNAIPGVNKVDIAFSPFWVTSAPTNTDKITIRFTVVNDAR